VAEPDSALDRADFILGLVLLAAGTAIAGSLLAGTARRGAPVVHDEFAYLLQARMLASGHLSMPSPPLPEFFETPHVLVVPRYAAKYFPGHAAMLAPFVLLGTPWLGPALLFGGTAALLFLALRLSRLSRLASSVAPLLLLGNAEAASAFAGYLSQSTSTFLCVGAVVAAAALWRQGTPARAALLGICTGWAALARPFTGLALALAAAVLFAQLRFLLRPRLALALAAPLVASAVLGLFVCHQITGVWTLTPWSLYSRQYVPVDGPGVGLVGEAPPLRSSPEHMVPLIQSIAASRRAYTAATALAEVPRRLRMILAPLPLAVLGLIALGLGALTPPLRFALAFALFHFVLLLDFHAVSALYLVEVQPMLLLVGAAGAGSILAFLSRLRPGNHVRFAAVALGLTSIWLGFVAQDELSERFRAAQSSAPQFHRYDAAFASVSAVRGLVFLRYPAGWNLNEDWTHNEPDLTRTALVRALDLDSRDAELMRAFPERPAFRLDLGKNELTPLRTPQIEPIRP
jgi:hypothetical protein